MNKIDDLLQSGLVGNQIRDIFIDKGLLRDAGSLIKKYGSTNSLVVCDKNTDSLCNLDNKLVLSADCEASIQNVEFIQNKLKAYDSLVAVGSGTISDLCKYASYLEGKDYIVFATAPSMNGYCSPSASISFNGYKKSIKAHLPKTLFFDLEVLCKAPKRLIRSGVGDLLCRSTCQNDWLLSHLVMGTPYIDLPFDLLKDGEEDFLLNSHLSIKGDIDVMKSLCERIVLSGLGMVIADGSYPASQGEHLIAHCYSMKYPKIAKKTFHGEQIAFTTQITNFLISRFHATETPSIIIDDRENLGKKIYSFFGTQVGKACYESSSHKIMSEKLKGNILENWDDIRKKISGNLMDSSLLNRVVKKLGLPTTPEELGWSKDCFLEVVHHSPLIRDRFTFLDLHRCSPIQAIL